MITLSQKDKRWANTKIGESKRTVASDGCLITDLSMFSDWYGKYFDPNWMAKNLSFNKDGRLIWKSIDNSELPMKFVWRYYQNDTNKIREILASKDSVCVLQVNNSHWLALVGYSRVLGFRAIDPLCGDYCWLVQRRYKITGFAELTRKANLEKPEEKPVAKLDLGVDISHYQKNIDWKKVKASGVGFVINKCTEATNYLDPTFADYKKNIQSNGMVWGCYHFARGGDVKKEAEWFLKNVGEVKTGDILVIDWEIQHKDPVGWCSEFIDIVTKKTGLKPFLYTNEARIKQYSWDKVAKKSLLWAAKYGTNNGKPQTQPVGGAWGKPTIWQFSSTGRVNGISGNVDLNKWLN